MQILIFLFVLLREGGIEVTLAAEGGGFISTSSPFFSCLREEASSTALVTGVDLEATDLEAMDSWLFLLGRFPQVFYTVVCFSPPLDNLHPPLLFIGKIVELPSWNCL